MSAFKDYFNRAMIEKLAEDLVSVYPSFNWANFVREAVNGLEKLELKDRSLLIASALKTHLPSNYSEAVAIIIKALDEPLVSDEDCLNDGFFYWPFADFVAEYGLDHFDESMRVNYEITKRFTAEFSIRPFIEKYPRESRKVLNRWVKDSNPHVRRLVSEGTRPRLPWASQLTAFIEDPQPNLPLLEKLKNDSSRYVTRSVANHLNDIGKDHPEILLEVCESWMEEASEETQWVIRHALRNHLKQGDLRALKLLGYGKPKVEGQLKVSPERVQMAGEVLLTGSLKNLSAKNQKIMLDYRLHLVRKNGAKSIKVFKWKDFSLNSGQERTLNKKHSFKPVSTRVYYPGLHRVDIQVNGVVLKSAEFKLNL